MGLCGNLTQDTLVRGEWSHCCASLWIGDVTDSWVFMVYMSSMFFFFWKVALPEGCEYVPLVKKAAKQAKVGFVISGGRASLSTLFCHYVIESWYTLGYTLHTVVGTWTGTCCGNSFPCVTCLAKKFCCGDTMLHEIQLNWVFRSWIRDKMIPSFISTSVQTVPTAN